MRKKQRTRLIATVGVLGAAVVAFTTSALVSRPTNTRANTDNTTQITKKDDTKSSENRVKLMKEFADKKATAKDIQKEMPKETDLDTKQAQKVADQHNLANQIQYNAQQLFPKDVVITSAKQPDGKYVLTDMTSGKSYKLTVDKDGVITSKEAI